MYKRQDGSGTQGTSRTLPAALTRPFGMAVYNERLLIANGSVPDLWEVDPEGDDGEGTKLRNFPSTLHNPQSMTVFNGRLFIVPFAGDRLWELDPDGANTQGTSRILLPPWKAQ